MKKYRKKTSPVEAMTFDEFIKYGEAHADNMVNGVPWSFKIRGCPVTHETNEHYIVETLEHEYDMTPKHVLVIEENDYIYPLSFEELNRDYEAVE